MKSYPKELYITIEEEGTEDEYLQVNKKPEDAAQIGKKKTAGYYTFSHAVVIESKVVTTLKKDKSK